MDIRSRQIPQRSSTLQRNLTSQRGQIPQRGRIPQSSQVSQNNVTPQSNRIPFIIGVILVIIIIVIIAIVYTSYKNNTINCLGGSDKSYSGAIANVAGCYCSYDYGWDGSTCVACGSGSSTSYNGTNTNITGCKCIDNTYTWNGSMCVSPVPVIVATPVVATPVVATPVVATPVVATPVVATPVVATPVVATPVVATPVVATPVVATPVVATPVVTTNVCPINSDPLYSGQATTISNCNCLDNYIWCNNTICTDLATIPQNIIIANADFEADTFITDSAKMIPTDWDGVIDTIYIVKTPNNLWGIDSAYSGSYVCGLTTTGSYIRQNFNTIIGNTYNISFYVCGKSNDVILYYKVPKMQMYIDMLPMGFNKNVLLTWTLFTINFVATNTSHLLTIKNTSANPDLTIYIDYVKITDITINTIINGDFEADYPSLSGIPTGWTVYGDVLYINSKNNTYNYISPSIGLYLCMFRSINAYISQVLQMVVNTNYLISFYLFRPNIYPVNSVLYSVLIDDVPYFNNSNIITGDTWIKNTFIFRATNTSHTIKFVNNSAFPYRLYLDNISMNKLC
jgi:hypothetical protein